MLNHSFCVVDVTMEETMLHDMLQNSDVVLQESLCLLVLMGSVILLSTVTIIL